MTTIPGVETFHPRTVWEPNGVDNWYGTWFLNTYGDLRRADAFHRTPPAMSIGNIRYVATHYTSAINLPDGDPGEILTGVDGIRALLARSTYDYLVNRTAGGYNRTRGNTPDGRQFPGYPLGYNFAIDWLGGVWEMNGFDYKAAATSGWNTEALAVLMLTDRADQGSELMWRSHRHISREALRLGAQIVPERVWAHGWFQERTGKGTATACCGPALKSQIEAGLADWTIHHDNEDTMIGIDRDRRRYDSRVSGGPLAANTPRKVQMHLPPATFALANLTVTEPTDPSFLAAWASGAVPDDSVNNWAKGQTVANLALIPVASDGSCLFQIAHGHAHLIVDVQGYLPR